MSRDSFICTKTLSFLCFLFENAVTFEKVLAGEFSYVHLLIGRHSFQKEVLGSRTELVPLVGIEATRRGNVDTQGRGWTTNQGERLKSKLNCFLVA